MFLRDSKCTHTYAIFHNANYVQRTCIYSALRFYIATRRVVPCLFFLTASAIYKPAQHTTTGCRTYKDSTSDSTTINYTCCKDLSVNAFFQVRATHLTRQVGSLPLAKNAKYSSSIYINFCIIHNTCRGTGTIDMLLCTTGACFYLTNESSPGCKKHCRK